MAECLAETVIRYVSSQIRPLLSSIYFKNKNKLARRGKPTFASRFTMDDGDEG